jgi:hypothetical protein
MIKTTILPVLAIFVWISLTLFLRNEILLKDYWVEHFFSRIGYRPGSDSG